MILNNYWQYLKVMMESGVTENTNMQTSMKKIGGNLAYYNPYYASNNTQITQGGGVRLGTGTNTYTADDYELAEDITSSISSLNFTYASAAEDDKLRRIITITGANSTNDSIVITEAAFTKGMQYVSGGYIRTDEVMFNIAKLETPVTVPPANSFVIVLEWDEM